MTRRCLILVSVLVLLSGWLLHISTTSGPSVTPALAQAEPTSTRPPVPPLATATPEPTAPPVSTPEESEAPPSEPPTPTPTLALLLPEVGGGKVSTPFTLWLGLALLIAGAATMMGRAHKRE
jgi:hypothetical protein